MPVGEIRISPLEDNIVANVVPAVMPEDGEKLNDSGPKCTVAENIDSEQLQNECPESSKREGISPDELNECVAVSPRSREVAGSTQIISDNKSSLCEGALNENLKKNETRVVEPQTGNGDTCHLNDIKNKEVAVEITEEIDVVAPGANVTVSKEKSDKDLVNMKNQLEVKVDTDKEDVSSSHMSQKEEALNTLCDSQARLLPLVEQAGSDANTITSVMCQQEGMIDDLADGPLHPSSRPPIDSTDGKVIVQKENPEEVISASESALNATKVVVQPKLNPLNTTTDLKKGDGKHERNSSAAPKLNPLGRKKPSVAKPNSHSKENNPPLLKKKAVANKENEVAVEDKRKNSVNNLAKPSNRIRSQTLGARLPSHRVSLAPSSKQSKNLEANNVKGSQISGNAILKENGAHQKQNNGTLVGQRRSPLVKKSDNINPPKTRGLKPPDTKGKNESSNCPTSDATSRLQPPPRPSLQPTRSLKLPLGPRSVPSIPSKGIVRSKSTASSSDTKLPPSKLPNIRPPTQARLPMPPRASIPTTATATSAGGGLRPPSKLLRPKKH